VGEIGASEGGLGEVGAAEIGPAEVRPEGPVTVPPLIPRLDTLLQNLEMRGGCHRACLLRNPFNF